MIAYAMMVGASVGLAMALAWMLDYIRRHQIKGQSRAAKEVTERVIHEARTEAETIRKGAELRGKETVLQAKTRFEKEIRVQQRAIHQNDKRVVTREERLDRCAEHIERREAQNRRGEQSLTEREQALSARQAEYERLVEETHVQLERTASLTREEARRHLMQSMVDEAKHEAAKHIRLIEQEAREKAQRRTTQITAVAIERLAGGFVAERTISVVPLPSDEMKGRIIGTEGRNIRAIEAATGADLIVDDTPEAVVVSCHNPIRREIARRTLERLVSDGRIHPGRIVELVRRAEKEVEESVRDAGQNAILDVGIHGMHPELVRLLGTLQYRHSYAQNVLTHSVEAAFICGTMAAAVGLDERPARRAALLHDIGKAATHEVEGSHAIIGAAIARKYGESAEVVNAIAAHHEEVKAETILAPLVDAANALAGARPGARREMLESYVRRLKDLERISNSFKGVKKSFAVQAGHDVRIIVQREVIDDDQATLLAHEVARRIENDMTYAAQIKVTVIREIRASEFAC